MCKCAIRPVVKRSGVRLPTEAPDGDENVHLHTRVVLLYFAETGNDYRCSEGNQGS